MTFFPLIGATLESPRFKLVVTLFCQSPIFATSNSSHSPSRDSLLLDSQYFDLENVLFNWFQFFFFFPPFNVDVIWISSSLVELVTFFFFFLAVLKLCNILCI